MIEQFSVYSKEGIQNAVAYDEAMECLESIAINNGTCPITFNPCNEVKLICQDEISFCCCLIGGSRE